MSTKSLRLMISIVGPITKRDSISGKASPMPEHSSVEGDRVRPILVVRLSGDAGILTNNLKFWFSS